MKRDLLKDRYGKFSSKRLAGLILLLYVLVITTLDGFDFFIANETLGMAILAVAVTLLGLDSVTDIWKGGSSTQEIIIEENETVKPPEIIH